MTAVTYTTPVKQVEADSSTCCRGPVSAIYYNPDNKVIQCHNCGHVYEPKSLSRFEDVFPPEKE